MKTNNMINRAKNTTVGKVLCRLVGEEAGAVMMEYVLVALLIAAACIAAVAYFGHDIAGMFGVVGKAATADSSGAQSELGNVRQAADDGALNGVNKAKDFSNL